MKKQRIQKVLCVCLLVLALVSILSVGASADMIKGLQDAKTSLMSGLKTVLDIVVGILLLVVVGVFLANLIGFLRTREDGQDHSRQLHAVAITIGVGILLGSWYAWGPSMMQSSAAIMIPTNFRM